MDQPELGTRPARDCEGERIHEEGGVYVENPNTGELIEVENTSEVIRLE